MAKKKKLVRQRLDAPQQPAPEPDDDTVIARFVAARELQIEDQPADRRPGRPSTYLPQNARIAKALCAKGATDAELSEAFGISIMQIRNWCVMHPEFGKAVREGKSDVFDALIERTLAQRALGYWVDLEEVKITKDGDIIRYPIRKFYPPDVTAQIFWLKNRQQKRWRDVWKIEHKTDTDGLTADQLLAEIRAEAEKLGLVPQQLQALGVVPMPKPNGSTKH